MPASRPQGGRPRSERARAAILQTTLEALERRGLDGLTIEGVAAEAGVGKATIYRWWPSRIALALDALEHLPELVVPDNGSFAADLRALLGGLTDLLVSTPLGGVLAHLGGDVASQHPEVRDYFGRRIGGAVEVVERAVGRGELPQGCDATALAFVVTGPVVNRVFYGPAPDDAYLDLVVRTMTAGLPAALRDAPTGRPA